MANRKAASILFVVALLVTLFSAYVALVYHGDIDSGAGWVSGITFGNWIAGFSVVLGLLFVVLIIMFIAGSRQQMDQGAWERPAPIETVLPFTCPHCGVESEVPDNGQRPLNVQCPSCNKVTAFDPNAAPGGFERVATEEVPPAEPEAGPKVIEREVGGVVEKFLVLRCGNCQNEFEVPFTETRPLVTSCTHCGRRGILK